MMFVCRLELEPKWKSFYSPPFSTNGYHFTRRMGRRVQKVSQMSHTFNLGAKPKTTDNGGIFVKRSGMTICDHEGKACDSHTYV